MEEVFQNLDIELLVANNCFDTDKVFMYSNGRNLLIVTVCPELAEETEGELLISDTFNLYAIMKVKIINCKVKDEYTELTCEVIPNTLNFFKRSLVRLETDLAVNYASLKPDENGELITISTAKHAVLKDLTPCGARIAIREHDILLDQYREDPVYLNLAFRVPTRNGPEKAVEIVSKVVNLKKSWKTYYIGVLFFIKPYHQYRIIEDFYNENLSKIKAHDHNKLLVDKNFVTLMKNN